MHIVKNNMSLELKLLYKLEINRYEDTKKKLKREQEPLYFILNTSSFITKKYLCCYKKEIMVKQLKR